MPFAVCWPGVTEPGSVVSTPVSGVDILPTVAEIAGLAPADLPAFDGASLEPLLKGEEDAFQRATPLIWPFPHVSWDHEGTIRPQGAIRKGDYKLIDYYASARPPELYDIVDDRSEETNVADHFLEKVGAMRNELYQRLSAMNAQMPERMD